MEINSELAYSEIYEIINLLEDEYVNKIPKKIIEFFEEERNKEYIPRINVNVPLAEQNLKRETMVILAILNLNYWCDSEEEKQELLKMFARNTEIKIQKQKELEEKYNPDNIFKKRQQFVQESQNTNKLAMIEYKEKNIIQRILNKILKMFKRK